MSFLVMESRSVFQPPYGFEFRVAGPRKQVRLGKVQGRLHGAALKKLLK